jgi:hypothetical protein
LRRLTGIYADDGDYVELHGKDLKADMRYFRLWTPELRRQYRSRVSVAVWNRIEVMDFYAYVDQITAVRWMFLAFWCMHFLALLDLVEVLALGA